MEITFDPPKRAKTLQERGLDFADAARMFAGTVATQPDLRRDYGEQRFISAGMLDGRIVVVVWTPRRVARHVISMRHCHDSEEKIWRSRMG